MLIVSQLRLTKRGGILRLKQAGNSVELVLLLFVLVSKHNIECRNINEHVVNGGNILFVAL